MKIFLKNVLKFSLVLLLYCSTLLNGAATPVVHQSTGQRQTRGVYFLILGQNDGICTGLERLLNTDGYAERLCQALGLVTQMLPEYPVDKSVVRRLINFEKMNVAYTSWGGPGSQVELVQAKIRGIKQLLNYDIVILCDTYSYPVVEIATKNLAQNAIHSVVALDPKIGGEINLTAIKNRVYNFYSKSGLGLTRKIRPASLDVDETGRYRSKVLNFVCVNSMNKAFNFYGKNIQGYPANLFEDVFAFNLPEAIRIAEENFNINWDLACVTDLDHRNPVVFINRYVKVEGGKFVVEDSSIKGGRWEYSIQVSPAMQEQYDNENVYNSTITSLYASNSAVNEITHKYGTPPSRLSSVTTALFGPRSTALSTAAASESPIEAHSIWVPTVSPNYITFVVFLRSQFPLPISRSKYLFSFTRNPGEYQRTDYFHTFRDEKGQNYAIVKFNVNKSNAKASYEFRIENDSQLYAHGNVPFTSTLGANEPYSFIVCNDIQKQRRDYGLNQNESGSAIQYLRDFAQKLHLESIVPNLFLELIAGDFVLEGSGPDAWFQIFNYLDSMSTFGEQKVLIGPAIGSHDFAEVWMPGKDIGVSAVTHLIPQLANTLASFAKAKQLNFSNSIPPYYGHLFSFVGDHPIQPTSLSDYMQKTQTWFDIGRVRFLHLPYPSEQLTETGTGADIASQGTDDAELSKNLNLDFTKIISKFNADLAEASAAREGGQIDFIIVYGHAPLATSPQFKIMHPGLLNWYHGSQNIHYVGTDPKFLLAEGLIAAMTTYKVDLYFSGHNHQYDRCTIKMPNGNITMAVTIGLGTELRHTHRLENSPQLKDEMWTINSERFITSNEDWPPVSPYNTERGNKDKDSVLYLGYAGARFLPAFLTCTVNPPDASNPSPHMNCRLLAKESGSERIVTLDEFTINKAGRPTAAIASTPISAAAQQIALQQQMLRQQLEQLERAKMEARLDNMSHLFAHSLPSGDQVYYKDVLRRMTLHDLKKLEQITEDSIQRRYLFDGLQRQLQSLRGSEKGSIEAFERILRDVMSEMS